tara:strand:- start:2160 stop:3074 length:915 start_codon:yes stop_codon:yes gene_type:complete
MRSFQDIKNTIHPIASLMTPGMWRVWASTVFLSLNGVCIKLASEHAHVMQIVTVRSFLGLLLCIASAKGNIQSLFGRNKLLLSVRGVLGMFAMIATFTAFSILPVAEATVIFFVNPVLVALLAWLVLGEKVGLIGGVSVLVCFGGVLLVAQPSFFFESGGSLPFMGVVSALVGACFSAGAMVTVRALGHKEIALSPVFYLNLCTFVGTVYFAIQDWVWGSWELWLILIAIGVLTHFGQYFMTRGLAMETAGRGSAVGYFQIVFAIIWGVLFFSELPNLLALIGAVFIFLGTLGLRDRPKGAPNS